MSLREDCIQAWKGWDRGPISDEAIVGCWILFASCNGYIWGDYMKDPKNKEVADIMRKVNEEKERLGKKDPDR